MDGSYDETMREVEEECVLMQSGVRFWQEKKQRIEESLGLIGTRNYERISQGTKRPYNDEGDDQAMPKPEEGPTQSNNVPTPLCTAPHSGRNTRSSQDFLVCHQHNNSSGSTNTGRRTRMVEDDVKLPLFHGNGIEDPEQYWFLYEAVWTVKQVQEEDIKKGQLGTTFRGCALDWYMKFIKVLIGN